jgi:hypothetical protein
MQSSSGSSAGGAVKAISSQDYQSSLGLGPAQIGNASGGGAQITTKSQNNTAGNWMEEGSNNAQTKKAPGKGMQLGKPKK